MQSLCQSLTVGLHFDADSIGVFLHLILRALHWHILIYIPSRHSRPRRKLKRYERRATQPQVNWYEAKGVYFIDLFIVLSDLNKSIPDKFTVRNFINQMWRLFNGVIFQRLEIIKELSKLPISIPHRWSHFIMCFIRWDIWYCWLFFLVFFFLQKFVCSSYIDLCDPAWVILYCIFCCEAISNANVSNQVIQHTRSSLSFPSP